MARRLILLVLFCASVAITAPAYADARVSVTPAAVDPTYATTLTVSGRGFQSVEGGHGGIYVFFGTVRKGWQPSRGGVTGEDYLYVPDSETRSNQGFQKFVAFPGSDTAGSANGGTLSASGAWSTTIVVPGATFQAYDRAGDVTTVDCRKVTCGVITVGAHGVVNAHNETFTPVRVARQAGPSPSARPTAAASAASADAPRPPASSSAPQTVGGAAPSVPGAPRAAGPATLEVDRAAAVAGHVLAFSATGLPAGRQVSVVFDDGAAAAGPFVAGTDGRLAGVVTLPADVAAGTHEMRVYGVDDPPSARFAVRAEGAEAAPEADLAASTDHDLRAAWVFTAVAVLALALAVGRLLVRTLRGRRAA